MVITRTVEMHAQLVGYDFKKKGLPTDKNIAVENSKVSNDYFWKTNKYTDQDVFGRTLDLTALINKPDGYLKGSLSDTEDVDYYEFNITEYRALSFAKDTYNKDITIIMRWFCMMRKAIRSALGKRMEMAVLVLPYRTGIRTTEVIP